MAVRVAEDPLQMVWLEPALTLATYTVCVVEAEHPFNVPVTV